MVAPALMTGPGKEETPYSGGTVPSRRVVSKRRKGLGGQSHHLPQEHEQDVGSLPAWAFQLRLYSQ